LNRVREDLSEEINTVKTRKNREKERQKRESGGKEEWKNKREFKKRQITD